MKKIGRREFLRTSAATAAALAVRGEHSAPRPKSTTRYLTFTQAAVETLLERQSARLGGAPDGVRCITITGRTMRTYGSLGGRKGAYRVARFATQPLELDPVRLDFGAWPVLDRLSEATGDRQYAKMVEATAAAFAEHGFEAISGLGYLGVQADFDVVNLKPLPVLGIPQLLFKPEVDLPLERLWAAAPSKMARMFKSAYYACITQPQTMAYNRYGPFGFDDSRRQPAQPFNPKHSGFALSGACLIHWWCLHHVRTGDAGSLKWAQAMADKWRAVQHAESGLVPHRFGADEPGIKDQPPMPFANNGDTRAAIVWLQAAQELAGHSSAGPLAQQLRQMGRRLLHGFARFGYDAEARIFPRWLHLDGTLPTETVLLSFLTQKEKDEAIRKDPGFADVPVFVGAGFYSDGPWTQGVHGAHLPFVPHDLAEGAMRSGDKELLAVAERLAAEAIDAARKLTSGFTALEQWTYSATASYIRMMLFLHEATGRKRYLEWAAELADLELAFFQQPRPSVQPEWWRLPFRDHLLESLLGLHQAIAAG